METIQQKNARLRALREARDGTPDEKRAHVAAAKVRIEALKTRATNAVFADLRERLETNPDSLLKSTTLRGYVRACRAIDRIK